LTIRRAAKAASKVTAAAAGNRRGLELLAFKGRGATGDADMTLADRARTHRNDIAHDMPTYIAKASHTVDVALLGDLCTLNAKIGVRWCAGPTILWDM
jgi:hypothetical protein